MSVTMCLRVRSFKELCVAGSDVSASVLVTSFMWLASVCVFVIFVSKALIIHLRQHCYCHNVAPRSNFTARTMMIVGSTSNGDDLCVLKQDVCVEVCAQVSARVG